MNASCGSESCTPHAPREDIPHAEREEYSYHGCFTLICRFGEPSAQSACIRPFAEDSAGIFRVDKPSMR